MRGDSPSPRAAPVSPAAERILQMSFGGAFGGKQAAAGKPSSPPSPRAPRQRQRSHGSPKAAHRGAPAAPPHPRSPLAPRGPGGAPAAPLQSPLGVAGPTWANGCHLEAAAGAPAEARVGPAAHGAAAASVPLECRPGWALSAAALAQPVAASTGFAGPYHHQPQWLAGAGQSTGCWYGPAACGSSLGAGVGRGMAGYWTGTPPGGSSTPHGGMDCEARPAATGPCAGPVVAAGAEGPAVAAAGVVGPTVADAHCGHSSPSRFAAPPSSSPHKRPWQRLGSDALAALSGDEEWRPCARANPLAGASEGVAPAAGSSSRTGSAVGVQPTVGSKMMLVSPQPQVGAGLARTLVPRGSDDGLKVSGKPGNQGPAAPLGPAVAARPTSVPLVAPWRPLLGGSNATKDIGAAIESLSWRAKGPCSNCGVKETSLWRRDPTNPSAVLCNPCGIYVSSVGRYWDGGLYVYAM
jgi:hypothetical protein